MQEGFGGVQDRLDGLDNQFGMLQLTLNTHLLSLEVRRKELLTWLGAVSTDEDYERALSARLDGTCDWILHRTEYLDWAAYDDKSDKTKILWIHGSAGFGKTVICARIVEQISYNAAFPVTHFFCVGGDEAKREPQQIVRSWVAQLVNHSEHAVELTSNLSLGKEARTATEADIWRIFETLSSNLGPCFYVIDGYDECIKLDLASRHSIDSQAKFLQQLTAKVGGTGSRLLLMSRDDPDIRSQLFKGSGGSSKNVFLEYKITSQDNIDDISSFSHDMVERELPNKPRPLKEEIALEAAQKCNGMFLWIKLMHLRLSPGKNAKQLREIVRVTPPGLDQAYERDVKAIMELGNDERMRAISILRWILFAARPLTVRELTEALIVSDRNTCDRFPVDDLPDAWDEYYTNDQIRRLCGSLIEIRSGKSRKPLTKRIVQFVHFSVKEYLTRADNINLPAGMWSFSDVQSEQSLLARICLRYLCYKDFTVQHRSTKESLQSKIDSYAFLPYAARSWIIHATNSGKHRQDLDSLINTLFEPEASRWLLWSEVLDTYIHSFERFHELCRNSYPGPMYYAAWLGLPRTMEFLRVQGLDLNSKGGICGSALQVAALNHNIITVEYLLQHNADVNIGGGEFGSAICAAASRYSHDDDEKEAVMRLLIDKGANIDSKDGQGRTALFFAASLGALNIIRLLHENNADHHAAATPSGLIPLHVAICREEEEAATLLLDLGSDSKIADNDGLTTLHYAVLVGSDSLVGRLLDRKRKVNNVLETGLTIFHGIYLEENGAVDINARSLNGMTALHIAVKEGHQPIVKLLLQYNADSEIARYDGRTPLYSATEDRDEAMVKLLLSAGAKANVTDKSGWTLLHAAVASGIGYDTIVQLLLDSGAEVNALSENGWTPLHAAIEAKCKSASIQLLEAGADPNLSGYFNQTALHYAVYQNWTRIIDSLLSYGADPLLRDGFGRCCMDWASSKRPIFAKLLRHCSDYRPTDSASVHEMLYHSIGSTLGKLKSKILQSISGPSATHLEGLYFLERLARCLLFIGDIEEASISLKHSRYFSSQRWHAVCDFCDSDLTTRNDRFICCSCPDVDACITCVGKREKDPCCGEHDFFKVSIDAGPTLLDGNVNTWRELIDGWLDPLAKKYGADLSEEEGEYLASVSDPKPEGDIFRPEK